MRKQPRAGQTIYDNNGCPIRLITCKRVAQEFVCEVWYKRIRQTVHLQGGKIVQPGYHDLLDKAVDDLGFGLVNWHHNRKKALNKGWPRLRRRSIRNKPLFITAKAPRTEDDSHNGALKIPDWYGVPSGSLGASCCAIADATIMVHVPVRVIEDPNNPENNGREVSMLMPKSRLDAIKKLTEGTK